MNLQKAALNLLEIKKSMNELNQEYISTKNRMNFMFDKMILSKQAVKRYQIVYWNHPELRDSLDYKYSYKAIQNLYEEIKKSYQTYCSKLNLIKKQIKDRQRQISKINHDIKEY